MNPQRSFIQTLIVPFLLGLWVFSLYLVYKNNPNIMMQEPLHASLSGSNKQTDILAMGVGNREDLFANLKTSDSSRLSHRYLPMSSDAFTDIDVETSDIKWTAVGSFLIINENKKLTVADPIGKTLWSFTLPGNNEFSVGQPAILGAVVYLSTTTGRVYAFDLSNGQLIWYIESRHKYFRAPLVTDDKLLLFAEEKSNQTWALLVLDAKNGENLKHYPKLELPLSGRPTAVDKQLYFATQNGQVRAFDIDDGKSIWSTEASSSFRSGLSIIGDRLYITNEDGLALIFDRKSGRKIHEFELGSAALEPLKVIEGTGIAVTIDTNGYLIAADMKLAKRIWRYNLNSASHGSHPFTLAQLKTKSLSQLNFNSEIRGWTVWTSCNLTKICIFDLKEGRLLHRINLNGEPLAQLEFAGDNNDLIIPVKSGAGAKLIGFREPDAPSVTNMNAAPAATEPALDK